MTAKHLKPMLESGVVIQQLYDVASGFARGEVHPEVVDALRMGRMTALWKDDGGVRGIVVGDVFRRVVARTIAKQFSKRCEAATAPFQFALSTRAGCECVTHLFRCHRHHRQVDLCVRGRYWRVRFDSRKSMCCGLAEHG